MITLIGGTWNIRLGKKWVPQTISWVLHILFSASDLMLALTWRTVGSLQDSRIHFAVMSHLWYSPLLSVPGPPWSCARRCQWKPACHMCRYQGQVSVCMRACVRARGHYCVSIRALFHVCVSTAVPVSACTCVLKFKHLLKMSHGSCSVNASPSLSLHRKFFQVFCMLLSKSPGGK